jgi:hypothetical protein
MSDQENSTPPVTPPVTPSTTVAINAVAPPPAPVVTASPVVPIATQPAAVVAVENQAKAVLGPVVSTWLHDFYDTNKWLFYTVIPLAVILMLVIKFHDILIALLLGDAKQLSAQAVKNDASLAAQAQQSTAQGDALVQKAQNETKQEQPVPDDWYKK